MFAGWTDKDTDPARSFSIYWSKQSLTRSPSPQSSKSVFHRPFLEVTSCVKQNLALGKQQSSSSLHCSKSKRSLENAPSWSCATPVSWLIRSRMNTHGSANTCPKSRLQSSTVVYLLRKTTTFLPTRTRILTSSSALLDGSTCCSATRSYLSGTSKSSYSTNATRCWIKLVGNHTSIS